MSVRRPGSCVVLILLVLLAGTAPAQSVHLVDAAGSGDFVDVQAAVDGAADGDVILVRAAAQPYPAVTIINRSLTLVGLGPERPVIQDMHIEQIDVGQTMTLRHLELQGTLSEVSIFGIWISHPGLEVWQVAGQVWLEDLLMIGAPGKIGSDGDIGGPGLHVLSTVGLTVVDSGLVGGRGGSTFGGLSLEGGRGCRLIASQASFHGCQLLGGEGMDYVVYNDAPGGTGLSVEGGAQAFVNGSQLLGGVTGDGPPTTATSAPGLTVLGSSQVQLVESLALPGEGGAVTGPAQVVAPDSQVVDLVDRYRAIQLPGPLAEGDPTLLSYVGGPQDLVLLRVGVAPRWSFLPALKGVDQLQGPSVDLVLGFADGAGELQVPVTVPDLPVGTDALVGFTQPFVRALGGALRLGAPSHLLILDETLPLQ